MAQTRKAGRLKSTRRTQKGGAGSRTILEEPRRIHIVATPPELRLRNIPANKSIEQEFEENFPGYTCQKVPTDQLAAFLSEPSELFNTSYTSGTLGDLANTPNEPVIAIPPSLKKHSTQGFLLSQAQSDYSPPDEDSEGMRGTFTVQIPENLTEEGIQRLNEQTPVDQQKMRNARVKQYYIHQGLSEEEAQQEVIKARRGQKGGATYAEYVAQLTSPAWVEGQPRVVNQLKTLCWLLSHHQTAPPTADVLISAMGFGQQYSIAAGLQAGAEPGAKTINLIYKQPIVAEHIRKADPATVGEGAFAASIFMIFNKETRDSLRGLPERTAALLRDEADKAVPFVSLPTVLRPLAAFLCWEANAGPRISAMAESIQLKRDPLERLITTAENYFEPFSTRPLTKLELFERFGSASSRELIAVSILFECILAGIQANDPTIFLELISVLEGVITSSVKDTTLLENSKAIFDLSDEDICGNPTEFTRYRDYARDLTDCLPVGFVSLLPGKTKFLDTMKINGKVNIPKIKRSAVWAKLLGEQVALLPAATEAQREEISTKLMSTLLENNTYIYKSAVSINPAIFASATGDPTPVISKSITSLFKFLINNENFISIAQPSFAFSQLAPEVENESIISSCTYNVTEYNLFDPSSNRFMPDYVTNDTFARQEDSPYYDWFRSAHYPPLLVKGTPVGLLFKKYSFLRGYLQENDKPWATYWTERNEFPLNTAGTTDYLRADASRRLLQEVWEEVGLDIEWLARKNIHEVWQETGTCAEDRSNPAVSGMILRSLQTLEHANPLVGAKRLSPSFTKEDHRLCALFSHIAYEPTDVIQKIAEDNSGSNIIYLGGFDEDPAWKKPDGTAVKHRIHAWYHTVTDAREEYPTRTRIRLYIVHRGSETAEDWAVSDVGIMKGTAPFYHERCMKLDEFTVQIQQVLCSKLSRDSNYIVEQYVAGHSLGGFLALVTSFHSLSNKLSREQTAPMSVKFDAYIIPVVFNPFVGLTANMDAIFQALPTGYVYRVRSGDVMGFDPPSMKFALHWVDLDYFVNPLQQIIAKISKLVERRDLLNLAALTELKDSMLRAFHQILYESPIIDGVNRAPFITTTNLNLVEVINTQSIIYTINKLLEKPESNFPIPEQLPKPFDKPSTSHLIYSNGKLLVLTAAAYAAASVLPISATALFVSYSVFGYGMLELVKYLGAHIIDPKKDNSYSSHILNSFDILKNIEHISDSLLSPDAAGKSPYRFLTSICQKIPSIMNDVLEILHYKSSQILSLSKKSFRLNHNLLNFIGSALMKVEDDRVHSEGLLHRPSLNYTYGTHAGDAGKYTLRPRRDEGGTIQRDADKTIMYKYLIVDEPGALDKTFHISEFIPVAPSARGGRKTRRRNRRN
jgi:hypothetical protein